MNTKIGDFKREMRKRFFECLLEANESKFQEAGVGREAARLAGGIVGAEEKALIEDLPWAGISAFIEILTDCETVEIRL